MINGRLQSSGFIDRLSDRVSNVEPITQKWQQYRIERFNDDIDNELAPDQTPLRNLSEQYQSWKSRKFPGRKKRELTGATKQTHKVTHNRTSVIETIAGNAGLLQDYLELPLLPFDTMSGPSMNAMLEIAAKELLK
ncbi:hypothetical protein [Chroococcidiopsis sp.]|uniref:hypothetical protein n=1 Tax=Chroococcidiopsis sp. TaxID=3088168 RepID=UPI003F2B2859